MTNQDTTDFSRVVLQLQPTLQVKEDSTPPTSAPGASRTIDELDIGAPGAEVGGEVFWDSGGRLKLKNHTAKARWCLSVVFSVVLGACGVVGQQNAAESSKKTNARPTEGVPTAEPFDGASVEKMASQCVTLETELGSIEIAMMPEVAPESVRNFLNLAATGAFDTTIFSRTVKDFVIQGGNLSTSERWNVELAKRMARKIPDEPGIVKHVRGIVSMARTDEPNSATTHFFILVGAGPHLDAKFSAFGTVMKGMEVADAINQAPADGEKPNKPVRINRALVTTCKK